jgi:hypothetical protein
MNNLIQNYEIILEAISKLPADYTPFKQIRQPKLLVLRL